MKLKITPLGVALASVLSLPAHAATVVIPEGTYSQNFDSMAATGSTEPAPGWSLRIGATATTLGSGVLQPLGPVRAWSHTGGQFKNMSSSNIASTSDATAQNANTNRTLGLRQVQSSFDPGMSFNFNFSSTGVMLDSVSFDLLMLDNQSRSTTFDIQFAVGASPSSFTTLDSWADPGTFGATTFTFDRTDFGSALDGESQVWIRIAALSASTGTGNVYDAIGIDNFSITASAVPEPSAALLGALGVLGIFRRRR